MITRPRDLRFRPAPLATGLALLAHLAFLRLFCRAGDTWVTLFGHEVRISCAFRTHTGYPCPGCGLSRSVVLAVCGRFEAAAHLNLLGPLLVAGALVFGLALFALGAWPSSTRRSAWLEQAMRRAAPAYAACVCLAWIGGWLWRLA